MGPSRVRAMGRQGEARQEKGKLTFAYLRPTNSFRIILNSIFLEASFFPASESRPASNQGATFLLPGQRLRQPRSGQDQPTDVGNSVAAPQAER